MPSDSYGARCRCTIASVTSPASSCTTRSGPRTRTLAQTKTKTTIYASRSNVYAIYASQFLFQKTMFSILFDPMARTLRPRSRCHGLRRKGRKPGRSRGTLATTGCSTRWSRRTPRASPRKASSLAYGARAGSSGPRTERFLRSRSRSARSLTRPTSHSRSTPTAAT